MEALTPRVWSPQQNAFIAWAVDGSGSCVLEARAGTGKTTLLLETSKRIRGQVAIVAYGRDIAEEVKIKIKELGLDWTKVQAGTVHSFGFGAIRKKNPKVKKDNFKVANIIEREVTEAGRLWTYRGEIAKLVSLAKQAALGVIGNVNDLHLWLEMAEHYDVFDADDEHPPVETVISMAQKVLAISNQDLDVVDFDDMVYLPLVHRLRMWQFDVVMGDEAQDTNAARRALMRALLKKGGRMIAVGDEHQGIFGFTGADADALNLIVKDFNCIRMPLTVSFRCPRVVVNFARQWVPDIEAADAAIEGSVSTIAYADLLARTDLNGEAAVLSRTNKPLVSLAFKLIRKRIPCRIAGREIGTGLKKLLQRWKITSLEALEKKLVSHLASQTTRLLAAKKETKLAELEDQIETARVIIDQCRAEKKFDVSDAVAYVESIFSDEDFKNMLTLSSIHKAKGKEWKRVFWLDRAGTCPSRWARQQWQQVQEKNLQYVAATRAQEDLIEVLAEPKSHAA